MKNENGQALFVFLVVSTIAMPLHGFLRGRSFFSPRSQSTHAERELVGWGQEINLYTDAFYGTFSAMPLYSKSIQSEDIADYLFGAQKFVISGSRAQPMRGS